MNIRDYDKKEALEIKRPKSWLKSVSAFANGKGGVLMFDISDDDILVGVKDAEGDAEIISETVKMRMDPVPGRTRLGRTRLGRTRLGRTRLGRT